MKPARVIRISGHAMRAAQRMGIHVDEIRAALANPDVQCADTKRPDRYHASRGDLDVVWTSDRSDITKPVIVVCTVLWTGRHHRDEGRLGLQPFVTPRRRTA